MREGVVKFKYLYSMVSDTTVVVVKNHYRRQRCFQALFSTYSNSFAEWVVHGLTFSSCASSSWCDGREGGVASVWRVRASPGERGRAHNSRRLSHFLPFLATQFPHLGLAGFGACGQKWHNTSTRSQIPSSHWCVQLICQLSLNHLFDYTEDAAQCDDCPDTDIVFQIL